MSTNPEPEPVFLSVAQVANRWGLSHRTIRNIRREELPRFIISRSIRFKLADIESYELSCSARGQRTLSGF